MERISSYDLPKINSKFIQATKKSVDYIPKIIPCVCFNCNKVRLVLQTGRYWCSEGKFPVNKNGSCMNWSGNGEDS